MYKDTNDLVYAVASRTAELANKSMDDLRLAAGYDCDTPAEARKVNRHMSRGQLVEYILTEEFIEEFPPEINKD